MDDLIAICDEVEKYRDSRWAHWAEADLGRLAAGIVKHITNAEAGKTFADRIDSLQSKLEIRGLHKGTETAVTSAVMSVLVHAPLSRYSEALYHYRYIDQHAEEVTEYLRHYPPYRNFIPYRDLLAAMAETLLTDRSGSRLCALITHEVVSRLQKPKDIRVQLAVNENLRLFKILATEA